MLTIERIEQGDTTVSVDPHLWATTLKQPEHDNDNTTLTWTLAGTDADDFVIGDNPAN